MERSMAAFAAVLASCIILPAVLCGCSEDAGWAPEGWPASGEKAVVTFSLGYGRTLDINATVARTDAEHQQGLMGVESLPAHDGMLFVFGEAAARSFWMKNTLIPLDIVFIGADGTVVNVDEAEPEPGVSDSELARYNSDGPAMYALELSMGTCARFGVEPGTEIFIAWESER